MFNNIKFRTKLISLILLISIIPIITITITGNLIAEKSLTKRTMEQLNSIQKIKKNQVESYFNERYDDIKILKSNPLVVNSIKEYTNGYTKGINSIEYKKAEDIYGSSLKEYKDTYGYYDIFLINAEGDIVYTGAKEDDFGTNIVNGKYSKTTLATAFDKGKEGEVLIDFKIYEPSNEPASFLSAPIKDSKGSLLGVLVFQLSFEQINNIMNEKAGLGNTGESYIVGKDLLMRTDSRFSNESTTLKQKVDTTATKNLFSDKANTEIIKDYRDINVLSAYNKLDIKGLEWGIIVEIDEDEALESIGMFRLVIVILAVFSILLIIIVSTFFANSMTKRMKSLTNIANSVSEGNTDVEITENSKDELGAVFKSFGKISSVLKELQDETHNIVSAVSDGNLKVRGNSENFKGSYKICIDGINNIVETMLVPINLSAEYIERISQGDIPEKITDNYKGDFNEIKNNLNICIDNITYIAKDVEVLVSTAVKGNLEVRAESGKHKGKFGMIIDSINQTLDVLVGHIDSIPLPVMIIDRQYNVRYMNTSASETIGISKKDVLNTKCYQHFKTSHCNTKDCVCNQAMSQNCKVSSETDAHPQGLDIDIKYIGIPIESENNEIIGCLEIIVDQTDIKTAERISKKQALYQSQEVEKIMYNLEKISIGNLNLSTEVSQSDDDTKEISENFKKINHSLNKSVSFIKEIVDYMYRVSRGDTNILVETKGLNDEISPAIKKIVDTLNLFIKEMDNMSDQHNLGDIDVVVNEDKFDGAYKKMAKGVNDMVNGHISVKKKAMACIAEFGKGNFEAELEKFPGKKVFINENIEKLRFNIKEFIREMENMSEQHNLGDIDVVVNEDKFDGAYKKMAKGVNDMVNGHISVKKKAMACIAEFGNGNFEAEIEKFPGKKVFINNTIETLRTNLKDVSSEIKTLIIASENGNLSERGNIDKFKGDWVLIVKGLNGLLDNIIKPIKEASSVLKEMSQGSLQGSVNGDYKGDHAEIKNALNFTIDKLNEIMENIKDSAEQVFIGSSQLSQSSQVLSEGSTEQASSIEEITSSMEEIAAQTDTNNTNASEANTIATSSKNDAVSGNKKMQEMLKSMGEINESSGNISKIIKVIDEIAFQTNILALNAAVEAARAGQHGKGFAVVAEEVRNLAARSAEAAKETTSLIEGSIEKVNLGTKIANDTAQALDQIVIGVTKVATIVSDISIASNEQSSGISQVNKAITQVSQVVQTNSATAEESASSSEQLSSQAEVLKDIVSTFKLRRISESKKYSHKIKQGTKHSLEKTINSKINMSPEESMVLSSKINLDDHDYGKY